MASWETTTFPTGENGGTITREFEWEYGNSTFTWQTEMPEELYEVQQRRHRIYDYGAYVADRFTQQFFADLATEIESVASSNQYDRREVVELASRFVQSLPYTVDSISTDYSNYPRFPIETLVDETGDCEDTSLLLAAILHGLGYRVGLLEFESHLGVGVDLDGVSGSVTFDGIEYSYIEPTDTSWNVGEVPPRLSGTSTTLHRIGDSPSLYTSLAGERRDETVSCTGVVVNAGKGTASNVVCQVRLKDDSGETVTALEQEWASISPDGEREWHDEVYVGSARPVTAEWRLGVEGLLHDQGEEERSRQ